MSVKAVIISMCFKGQGGGLLGCVMTDLRQLLR